MAFARTLDRPEPQSKRQTALGVYGLELRRHVVSAPLDVSDVDVQQAQAVAARRRSGSACGCSLGWARGCWW